jgi:metallo-beta-lactamase class B
MGQDAERALAAVKFRFVHLLLCFCFVASIAVSLGPTAIQCAKCVEWNRAQKPFRIFGNTYYVGTHGLSSILITSKDGHVLIDGDLPQSAKQISENIRTLGFRITDVKLILNSHVHFDHAGGIARLQRLSDARVLASEWSAEVLRTGRPRRGDPQYVGGISFAPVARVEEIRDGEQIRAGKISMKAHLTPGHTPGGTSWTWESCDGSVCRNMVYADSLTPVSSDGFRFTDSPDHPHALEDFAKSFAFLETTPCDILITTHPENSSLWERLQARENGTAADPMVNPGACSQLAKEGRELLRQRIAEERARPGRLQH